MLDEAGFYDTKIVASNDLDEYTIINLKAQGAKIDIWGIGTKLITAYDQPALGGVYKLVSIEDEAGNMQDTIKISGNPEKVTTPGLKRVYRIINDVNGKSEGDYICMESEHPETDERLKMFHPTHTYISKFVTNFTAVDIHQDVIKDGKLVYETPDIFSIQKYSEQSLEILWDEYKRSLNPEEYPVDLNPLCWENKMNHIEKVKISIQNRK